MRYYFAICCSLLLATGCDARYEPQIPPPPQTSDADESQNGADSSDDRSRPALPDPKQRETAPRPGEGPTPVDRSRRQVELPTEAKEKIALLAQPDRAKRLPGTEYLEGLGEQADEYLLAALAHSDADLRAGAAFGLLERFQPWDKQMVAAASDGLQDEDPRVRSLSLTALQGLPDEQLAETLPRLVAILNSDDDPPHVRAKAARLLERAGAAAREPLRGTVHDAGAPLAVRAAALNSLLEQVEPAVAVSDLQKLLADESATAPVRLAVAKLASLGPLAAPAAEALIALLGSEEERVRQAAFRALSSIGPAVLEPLQQAARSATNPATRQRAAQLIEQIKSRQ